MMRSWAGVTEFLKTRCGFDVVETGGGCTALRKRFADGSYIMLTDDTSADLGDGSNVVIGFYPAAPADETRWACFDAALVALEDAA